MNVRFRRPAARDELLPCGHHYRVSRAAPSAAHARVEGLRSSSVAPRTWFDDHVWAAQVTAAAR